MTPRRWTSGRDAVAAWLLGLAVLGLAGPNAARALSSRWREVHTPGSGPERVLAPEVRDLRAALQRAGARAFMFTPALASETAIAPFLVEASWPIECLERAAHVVGETRELSARPDCVVLQEVGRLALARCHL